MRKVQLVGFVVAAVLVAAAGCGRTATCECPGCSRAATKSEEYVDTLTDGKLKRVTVRFCDEHHDKRPNTWPGEFFAEGRIERATRQHAEKVKADAERDRVDAAKLAEYERRFPENMLGRADSGDTLAFKPRYLRSPQAGTLVALVYSQPAAPPLDEAQLKRAEIRFDDAEARLTKGLSLFQRGVPESPRVTLIVPSGSPISEGRLAYYQPDELRVDEPATLDGAGTGIGPGQPGDPPGTVRPPRCTAPMTAAIGEFVKESATLRFVGFLTPICEAKPLPKVE